MKFLFSTRFGLILFALSIAGMIGAGGYLYAKGWQSRGQKELVGTLTETVETQETLNEIRNHRTDRAGVSRRMRGGTF